MAASALIYEGLVLHYLHVPPADDVEEFAEQVGLALALEERFMKQLATITANAVAKALGGK